MQKNFELLVTFKKGKKYVKKYPTVKDLEEGFKEYVSFARYIDFYDNIAKIELYENIGGLYRLIRIITN